jgi:hypothetical protein
MSTSRHEGRVLIASPDFGGGSGQFCDAIYLRDGLINGLNHAADEWSQVRINIMSPLLSLATGTQTHGLPAVIGSDDPDAWVHWMTFRFPVTAIEAGGAALPHLFRFHVAATSDDAGMDAELRAVLVPDGAAIDSPLVLEASDSVWVSANISGGDPVAYNTGVTQGDEAYTDGLVMPATPGGPLFGSLALFFQTTSDSGVMELHALHLSEVVPV